MAGASIEDNQDLAEEPRAQSKASGSRRRLNKTPRPVKGPPLDPLAKEVRADGPGPMSDGVSEAGMSDVSIDPSDYQPEPGKRRKKSDSSKSGDNSETSSWKSIRKRIYDFCDR